MQNTFTAIRSQHFYDFYQAFPNAARQDLCHGCDGTSTSAGGVFAPVCLLPGELAFLQEKTAELHLEPTLDRIITPHGIIYSLTPVAVCPYRRPSPFFFEKEALPKPVECTIYPLSFSRQGSDELRISPYCRRQATFRKNGFLAKVKVAMAVYILPYLEESWLRHRNTLNFPLDLDSYRGLKSQKAGQPITLKEFQACAVEDFN